MKESFILHYKNGSNSNVWQNEDYNNKKTVSLNKVLT